MNFQFYFEKLIESKAFKKFISENKDAFLCSAFFAVDKNGSDNKQNIDYFVPSLNKMYSFKMDGGVELVPVEDFGENFKPVKIPDNVDFDFDYLEKLLEGEMFEKKLNNKIEKMLWSLQEKDNKTYLLGTIFISGLALIKTRIDVDAKKVLEFEKIGFFEMMKIVKK